MPKVLFVVHGMGDHLPGWSTELVDQLDQTLAVYPKFAAEGRPFRDRVIVEEITYDAVFDKMVEPWGRQRAALEQFARDHGLNLDDTLSALTIGQLPADASDFVWETLLDAVLYRGSSLLHDNVRQSVTLQFLNAWDKHLTNNPTASQVDVSILCHSQGTIVMSDVLAQIGEGRRPEFVPFSAAKQTVDTFITLANVSRLGPPDLIDIDSRITCVRPETAPAWKTGRNNYLRRFINVRHEFDPFCLWQRFEPKTDWGKGYVNVPGVKHVHQANTHGYLHYLANPRVHVPIFRAVLGSGAITKAEEQTAIDEFPDIKPDACATAIDALRTALSGIANGSFREARALDDLIVKGVAAYLAAKAALEACPALLGGFDAS
jgi:hypothetical protein